MNICLKSLAREGQTHEVTLVLKERLPHFVDNPCSIICHYSVKKQDNYYLLTLDLQGDVRLVCQRCLQIYSHLFSRVSTIAICPDDERASKLMEQYDCLVAGQLVNLEDIVTDELHLYIPEKHEDERLCDPEIFKYFDS